VGLDVSAEALRAVEAGLAARRPAAPVRLVESAIEDLDAALPAQERFDLVLACFSLYYVASPEAALAAMRRRVLPGGRVFVCGPGPDNNREFLALCDAVVPRSEQAQRRDETLVFMDATLPQLAGGHFASVREHSFENPVVFPDVPSVLAYWRSYHLYSSAYEGAFQGAVEAHVARHGSFSTVKRVRGALLA
jgi:SAM-dependent methyltransferase